jgi:lysophospholipase L1-like esterase
MTDEPRDPITPESRPGDGDAPAGVHDPSRRSTARGALIAVLVAVLVLVAFEGAAVRRAGDRAEAGWQRDVLRAVGGPTGWIADRLPFSGVGDRFNAVIGGDGPGDGGRRAAAAPAAGGGAITADAFDPAALGERARAPRALKTLLVTGDSMATPLDAELARRVARSGVRTTRDPHIGTGISQPEIVDWRDLSAQQTAEGPDASVVFLGANEGFPLDYRGRPVECCGPAWAATYATSVRAMMATYRARGDVRVYWLLLPIPRDRERREVAVAVNAAIRTAATAYRAQVRVVDLERVFTPGGRYRDAMPVAGRERLVRESDGIHLNGAGSQLAADVVLEAIRRDYGAEVGR